MLGERAVQTAFELLERGEELGALESLQNQVIALRSGRQVLISGEAGVGKTALVRRFCAGQAGTVLTGACESLATPRPLAPFLDVAQQVGGELSHLLRDGGRPHEVCQLLLREAGERAVAVLVIEDLHWADAATLDVVRLLARRADEVPLLLVGTYRDDELGRRHPLRGLLGELPPGGPVRIRLQPLSPAAVDALARGRSLNAEELHRRTGGNPFFVTEVLAGDGSDIPAAVRDAVLARVARLSAAAQDLLEAIAAVPPFVDTLLLELLAPGQAGALEECLASGVLVARPDGVEFRHELARDAVFESINPVRRRQLNRQALQALAEAANGRPDVTRLAHHAEAAGEAAAVLEYAPAAAALAAARGAHRESAAQYARALRFADRLATHERAELLARHAQETYLTDQFDPAIASQRAAVACYREAGDRLREGDAIRKLCHLLRCGGHHQEARRLADEAVRLLEDLPPGPELALTYALIAMLHMNNGDHAATLEWGERTIALAGATETPAALLHALNSVGTLEVVSGDPAGVEKLSRSLDLALELGLDEDVGRAYLNYAGAATSVRLYKGLDDWLTAGLAYCAMRGLDLWGYYLLGARAQMALDFGDWDLAVELAHQVLEQTESSLPRFEPLLVIALVRARRGDPDWRSPLAEARATAEEAGELQTLAPVAIGEAEIAWLDGRGVEIRELTEDAFQRARREVAPWWAGDLACWRRRAGVVEMLPDGFPPPHAAELAGSPAAAARRWLEIGCRYEAAIALMNGSEAQLADAHARLLDLGARRAAAIAAKRLREAGVSSLARGPRRSTLANPARLTRREVEILRLLPEERSNAAIATRLFLSPRTVDHHVSALLDKLEVANRHQAIDRARALGIL